MAYEDESEDAGNAMLLVVHHKWEIKLSEPSSCTRWDPRLKSQYVIVISISKQSPFLSAVRPALVFKSCDDW